MKKFFHRLFCKHEYHLKASYRTYNGKSKRRDIYVCHICGKPKVKCTELNYNLDKVRV